LCQFYYSYLKYEKEVGITFFQNAHPLWRKKLDYDLPPNYTKQVDGALFVIEMELCLVTHPIIAAMTPCALDS
jgi:hypothetical protein